MEDDANTEESRLGPWGRLLAGLGLGKRVVHSNFVVLGILLVAAWSCVAGLVLYFGYPASQRSGVIWMMLAAILAGAFVFVMVASSPAGRRAFAFLASLLKRG